MADFNAKIIEEFRANGGRVGGELAGNTIILVHHTGARSGRIRVTPLVCSPLGDGRFAIIASNAGSPTHPAWYHNLKADPKVTVELGTATFWALAEEADEATRTAVIAESPAATEFQARTARKIPVFVLTRQLFGLTGWADDAG